MGGRVSGGAGGCGPSSPAPTHPARLSARSLVVAAGKKGGGVLLGWEARGWGYGLGGVGMKVLRASSPKWLMTLTAKRPVGGWGKGREVSR